MTVPELAEVPSRAERVLLVDDRKDNLLALEAVLEPLHYQLVKASSGIEALRSLLQGGIAAIVLDVQMPEMDGFETAALVKARAATRHIPIVFLTAISPDREHELRGYNVGAVDYICKPFDPEVLRAKVRALVEMSGTFGAIARPNRTSRAKSAKFRASREEVDDGGRADPGAGATNNFRNMVRALDIDLEAGVEMPRIVRSAVREALDGLATDAVETVALLVSELATNAVVHACSNARVILDVGPRVLRVEVIDTSSREPNLRATTPFDNDGRGLDLVRLIAQRSGWTRLPRGKAVWFELDLSSTAR